MADTVMATFQVKAGMVDRLSLLLDKHYATIVRLGLGGGPKPVRVLLDQPGGPVLYDIFDWNAGAIGTAHENLEVKALWAEIDACCESRGGRPGLDFPHVRRLTN
jgi:hypothetical protein